MAAKIISLRVPVEALEACGVAAAAEGCSRSAWMVRALEDALGYSAASPRAVHGAAVDLDDPANASTRSQLGVSTHRLKSDDSSSASNRAPAATTTGGFDPPVVTPGSRTGPITSQRWAMDRQRKLNAGKEKRA